MTSPFSPCRQYYPPPHECTPTEAQYSLNLRVRLDNVPGVLGRNLATAIGEDRRQHLRHRGLRGQGPDPGARHRGQLLIGRAHQGQVLDVARTASPASPCSTTTTARSACTRGARSRCSRCFRWATATTSRWPTPPGRGPGLQGHPRRRAPGRHPHHPQATRWPSCPTGPRCWASATSAPRQPCRSWRARRCCSRSSGQVDAFPICLDVDTPEELIETVVRLAPDLWRHQPRGHRGPRGLRGRGGS